MPEPSEDEELSSSRNNIKSYFLQALKNGLFFGLIGVIVGYFSFREETQQTEKLATIQTKINEIHQAVTSGKIYFFGFTFRGLLIIALLVALIIIVIYVVWKLKKIESKLESLKE